MIFDIDSSSFLKVIDEQNTLRIPKYGGQNLACWCLHLWSLWMAFTCCCPCFIHCCIFMQKRFFVLLALKQLQTMLWIVNMLLLFDCEQMWHPLWTQLSHWQMFMQNGEYTAFWYLQLLCYLMQLQFMIGQNKFIEFFGVFWNNCRIWTTWTFSSLFVCMTAFKVSIPPLNRCFRRRRF